MKKFNLTAAALILSTLPLTVFAQESTLPEPPAEETTPLAAPTPNPVAKNKIGPYALNEFSVMTGASNGGLGVGVGLKAEALDGSRLTLDARTGEPVLLLSGSAEAFPVNLITIENQGKIETLDDLESSSKITVTFLPVSAKAAAMLPSRGKPARHHVVVDPQLIAAYGQKFRSKNGLELPANLKLRVGAAGGAAHDGDGGSFLLGARVGFDSDIAMPLGPTSQVFFELKLGQVSNVIDRVAGINGSHEMNLGWRGEIAPGQKASVALHAVGDQIDVVPNATPNTDNAENKFLGFQGTLLF